MQARRAALLKLNESYDGLGDAMATDPTEIPVDFLRAQPLLAVQMAALVVAPGSAERRTGTSRTRTRLGVRRSRSRSGGSCTTIIAASRFRT